MAEYVEVRTQAELDKALKRKGVIPIVRGDRYFEVYDSSQVRACDSSQVTAYGSSQVRAYGSSQVRAYNSSQVRAYDSSQVTACDSSQVTASKYVAVTRDACYGRGAKITGGVLIEPVLPTTAAEWCEVYGVEVKRGIATLYKGLDNDFKSGHGMGYAPGTKPKAPDWDGGERECGGGLHFSPTPGHTLRFMPEAKRFVACPVRVKDIVVHKQPTYPSKVKAPGVCGPVFEVDIHGNPVAEKAKAAWRI